MDDLNLNIQQGKKAYFASDFHLGVRVGSTREEQLREREIVDWLNAIRVDAGAVFLLGDLFDFWFEYRHVVPKGFVRFQAAVASLCDAGIPVYFFSGNHDLWMSDYLEAELGVVIVHHPVSLTINGTTFHIGHGDGLGPGDSKYKLLKKIFTNPLAQWLFRLLHPDLGIALARRWSAGSRLSKLDRFEEYHGEKEYLLRYCRDMELQRHHKYYIFGHRHLVLDVPLTGESRYINLGDWLNNRVYAIFDGDEFILEKSPL